MEKMIALVVAIAAAFVGIHFDTLPENPDQKGADREVKGHED